MRRARHANLERATGLGSDQVQPIFADDTATPQRPRMSRVAARYPAPAREGSAYYLMKPAERIHDSVTTRGFMPSTLTSLFRAMSVSVASLSAIGLNSVSKPGYFLATSLRTESAGL